MGHRTLVAYDRDRYDLHYAHWGVDPADITPGTPFGGPPDVDWARACSCALLDPAGGELTADRETTIDPDPLATGLSFASVCDHVDPLEHEALYVVGDDFAVRTYLVFALGVDGSGDVGGTDGGDDPTGGHGGAAGSGTRRGGPRGGGTAGRDRGRSTAALVGYDGERDAAYLRGWLAGARSVRDVARLETEAVVRALRWLEPDRGAVVWLVREHDA